MKTSRISLASILFPSADKYSSSSSSVPDIRKGFVYKRAARHPEIHRQQSHIKRSPVSVLFRSKKGRLQFPSPTPPKVSGVSSIFGSKKRRLQFPSPTPPGADRHGSERGRPLLRDVPGYAGAPVATRRTGGTGGKTQITYEHSACIKSSYLLLYILSSLLLSVHLFLVALASWHQQGATNLRIAKGSWYSPPRAGPVRELLGRSWLGGRTRLACKCPPAPETSSKPLPIHPVYVAISPKRAFTVRPDGPRTGPAQARHPLPRGRKPGTRKTWSSADLGVAWPGRSLARQEASALASGSVAVALRRVLRQRAMPGWSVASRAV